MFHRFKLPGRLGSVALLLPPLLGYNSTRRRRSYVIITALDTQDVTILGIFRVGLPPSPKPPFSVLSTDTAPTNTTGRRLGDDQGRAIRVSCRGQAAFRQLVMLSQTRGRWGRIPLKNNGTSSWLGTCGLPKQLVLMYLSFASNFSRGKR